MNSKFYAFLDWFIPDAIANDESDRLMARTFVLLHLLGPLMGHSVTWFLWSTGAGATWQFWVTEVMVAGFWGIPFLLKWVGNLRVPAMTTVQMLVGLSLFGSFMFGGISSPFLPWFLIAMVLGFFYLAEEVRAVLTGIGIQLVTFFSMRILLGEFPELIAPEALSYANIFSIVAALAYMTLLSLYYEKVMRISVRVEQEAIEQRGRLNDLRTAMEAAEAASRRKSIFLAKMSHELRTPLNAVIGYTEMLRESFDDKSPGAVPEAVRKMEDLNRIHTAGSHLLALVDDVIDLSSIEAKRIEIVAKPVAVTSLVNEVIATASPLISKRDNRMVVVMPQELGVLELDALKLRQCLLNLLSNSAKFTTKGTIMLTIRRIERKDGAWMQIEVTDDGIGMSREGLDRLFVDFNQADDNISSMFGGTGLGLALTKRFCEMMGGDITVRSERGVGTSFTISIPIRRARQRPRKTAKAA